MLKLLENSTINSSSEKQSSAIIVHKPKRTATSTRTIHTRQNKPYRLGAAPAGVVGARGRCCPAATVPAAVVFGCGVRRCIAGIAEKKQNKIINRKTELCHHRSQTKAHSNEYENNTHKAEQSLPAWRAPAGAIGPRGRCFPAATVPVAVVFAGGVCCCICLLYTSPSPRDGLLSRMPSSA